MLSKRLGSVFAASVFCGVVALTPSSVSAQQLSFTAGAPPTVQLAPNAAYGTVRFRLELLKKDKPTKESVFDVLLKSLQGIMKNEGQYTLTVELLSGAGDEVLARRAILSAQRTSSGWFIFNRKTSETQAIEWYGDFPISVLVSSQTNNIRVRVRSYYSEQSKFDMETFNLLMGFVANAKILGAANTALDATWKPLAQSIEGLLSSYKQSDISDIATLSFARLDGNANPASGTFVRNYTTQPDGDEKPTKYTVKLLVETRQGVARVASVTNGKIDGATSFADVLAAARIGDQPIDLVLSTSKNDPVQKFMADLKSTAGYKGEDIGERCDQTYGELARHFTVTDKVISYWALLHLYRRKLAANANARECLSSGVREQMEAIGLKLADLPFAKPATVAVAGGGRGGQALEATRTSAPAAAAAPAIDKVVPTNEVVEKLLGEKGTSRTFQVFPIDTAKE